MFVYIKSVIHKNIFDKLRLYEPNFIKIKKSIFLLLRVFPVVHGATIHDCESNATKRL